MEKNQILGTIAANLKKLLRQSEISSSELARRCRISSGSISKIIKGSMSITIPMAMNIAKGLGVSLNELLDGLTMPPENALAKKKEIKRVDSFSVGILSLNNKRVACVKNHRGKIIGTSELEGSLDLAETSGSLLQAIQKSIFEACPFFQADTSKLKLVRLNLVAQSFEFEDTRNKFLLFAHRHFKEVMVRPDWELTHIAAFGKEEGISLIVDKGVSLSYRYKGALRKLGGWKFPIYDLGGENWLGLEAIRHAVEAAEERVPMTRLARDILAKFNGKIERITEICFKRTHYDKYCLFSDLLLRSYLIGETAATSILNMGFQLIYSLIEKVDSILGKPVKITLNGSVADIYKPFFSQPRLVVSPSDKDKASLLADFTKEYLLELEGKPAEG